MELHTAGDRVEKEHLLEPSPLQLPLQSIYDRPYVAKPIVIRAPQSGYLGYPS